MNDDQGKRMIADTGYEVAHTYRIGGKELLLAENADAENGEFYLVCGYHENGIIGEYFQAQTTGDYLEAAREFSGRLSKEVEMLQAERDTLNLPGEIFTAEHCFTHSYDENITGKVVAIKANIFSPEYRRGDTQLVWVTGGNGAQANARGNAVYCYHLNDGTQTRFERYQVLGVVKELPPWANDRLNMIMAERESARQEQNSPETAEINAGYKITERIQVGKMLFVLGEHPNEKYVTWQRYGGRSGYDHGHYFDSRDKAVADLHDRADQERAGTADKTRNPNNRDDAR